MELKGTTLVGGKGCRLLKFLGGKKKSSSSNGGVVSCYSEEDINGGGVVRMKIVVRKSELKQLVELVNGGNSNNGVNYQRTKASSCSSTAEQRLNQLLLRKKHISSKSKPFNNNDNSWIPALQSIPE
ncbi:hypothetical protein PIB30_004476 [Stylosanthes scabra]|uniref:Uncharacterized protein n=1 Tax=Stylosanthes scabra TaxID=79078 RepID=A0ABU6W1W4_9FABA|nr:hypothetical protein [Stylosanthes scabra]